MLLFFNGIDLDKYEYFKNLEIQDVAASFRKLAFNHFRIGHDMSAALPASKKYFFAAG